MDGTISASNNLESLVQPNQSSPLLLFDSDPERGILCNDPTGLCMASQGKIDSKNAGVYTSLVRLASLIPETTTSSSKKQQGGASSSAPEDSSAPLITIEYESHAMIIKEYDGHVVAIRVPTTASAAANGSSTPGVTTTFTPDSTRSASEVGAISSLSSSGAPLDGITPSESVESSS